MSLGIGIETSAGTRGVTSFENDGYYWALCPFFEKIRKQTGKFIDLYEIFAFEGADLLPLLKELDSAKLQFSHSPENWDVETGREINSGRILYRKVNRGDLLQMLDALISATREAIADKGRIHCIGD